MRPSRPLLIKTPSEVRLYEHDLGAHPEFEAGDTIATVTSKTVTPTGPTLGGNVISGARVQYTISGGTAGVKYLINLLVTTVAGRVIEDAGEISVVNFAPISGNP